MAELIGHQNIVKNEIVNQIMGHPLLVKLLFYKDTNVDIFTQPDLTFKQIRQVKRENIYESMKIPLNNQDVERPYLTMQYGNKNYHSRENSYFNGNDFNIYVFCNTALDDTLNGSRISALEHCVCEIFDKGNVASIGSSELGTSTPIAINGTSIIGRKIPIIFLAKNAHMINKAVGR